MVQGPAVCRRTLAPPPLQQCYDPPSALGSSRHRPDHRTASDTHRIETPPQGGPSQDVGHPQHRHPLPPPIEDELLLTEKPPRGDMIT